MQALWLFFGTLLLLFFLSRILISEVSGFLFEVTKNRKITVYFLAILFLPGTIIHEMAHVFAAELLRVPTGDIDILPKIEGRSVKLGSVPIAESDPMRMFIIGAAPFLVGTFLIIFIFALFLKLDLFGSWWSYLVAGYIAFEIGNTMFSSRRDMEGALELLAVCALAFGILYFVGVRVEFLNPKALIEAISPTLGMGARFLAIPLLINIGLIAFIKLAKKIG